MFSNISADLLVVAINAVFLAPAFILGVAAAFALYHLLLSLVRKPFA